MPRTKRGPGATHDDLPSKRGGKGTIRRPIGCGEMTPAANDEVPVLRDALGLPPRFPNPAANVVMMEAAGDDEDGHWCNDFEAEEHRRPTVM